MLDRLAYLEGENAVPQNAEGEPVFKEPWESRAFAMTIALYDKGAYVWNEFQAHLIAEIAEHGDEESYYEHWLESFEALLLEKNLITKEEFEAKTAELSKPK